MMQRGRRTAWAWCAAALATLAVGAGEPEKGAAKQAKPDGEPLKVLMVGNSFSVCVRTYLPRIAKAQGVELELSHATIGGCSLNRHVKEMDTSEANPDHKPYRTNGPKGDINDNLRNILTRDKWDIITIQQWSQESWRPDTFEPAAERLFAFFRELAPQAEIVVQQTWAYRADSGLIRPGSGWGIDQDEMYKRLTKCYHDLARRYGLRVIPTGQAIQFERERSTVKFTPYDPEVLKTLNWPDLPSQAGDVVGSMWWRKNKEKGRMEITADTIHLNKRGEYLQACTWFGFLFPQHRDEEIKFIADEIGDDDAVFLAECARAALATLDPDSGNLSLPEDDAVLNP